MKRKKWIIVIVAIVILVVFFFPKVSYRESGHFYLTAHKIGKTYQCKCFGFETGDMWRCKGCDSVKYCLGVPLNCSKSCFYIDETVPYYKKVIVPCGVSDETTPFVKPPESCEIDKDCGDPNYFMCKNGKCVEVILNCGDGIIQSGEECENTSDCEDGELCDACECKTPEFDYNCESIVDNGDLSEKINFFFIHEGYGKRTNDYSSDVQKYLYGEPENNKKGFFDVAPYNETSDRFNIYQLTSKSGEYDCSPNFAPSCMNDVVIDHVLISCGFDPELDKDRIIIVNLDGGGRIARANEQNIFSVNGSPQPLVYGSFMHEVGHIFGNFGEEYIDVYIPQPRTVYPPNVDSEGCPKWCSGELNTQAPCYNRYLEYLDCVINKIPEAAEHNKDKWREWMDCYRAYTKILVPGEGPCDLGSNCKEDSGCWFGGESVSDWRAYEYSIMRSGSYYQKYGYGKINEEYLFNKIINMTK